MSRNNRYTAAFGFVAVVLLIEGGISCADPEDVFWYFALGGFGCDLTEGRLLESANLAPLSFESNLGQADARYPYLARGRQHSILLSATETVFELPERKGVATRIHARLEGARAET